MSEEIKSELKLSDDEVSSVVHCGTDIQSDWVRTDGTDFVAVIKTESETNNVDANVVGNASNIVKRNSIDDFSLSKNNLSQIKTLQEQEEACPASTTEPKPTIIPEPIVKPEPTVETSLSSSKLANGHHDAAKKSRRHDGDEKSSHHDRDRHRDRDRDRDRDRYRPKRANIGIQCRRDKTLDKTVGFAPSAPPAATATSSSTTVTAATTTAPVSATPTPTVSSEVPAEVRMSSGFVSNPRYAGYSMANPCYNLASKYKYGHLFRVEIYPNGGGKVLHLWQDEFAQLGDKEVDELAREFVQVE